MVGYLNIQNGSSGCLKNNLIMFISSPEHEVLMVSYCDQSMSVVRRPSCVVRRQQFVLKANSSYTLGPM